MANGFIQSNNSSVATCAFTSNNTAGNLLVLVARLTTVISITGVN